MATKRPKIKQIGVVVRGEGGDRRVYRAGARSAIPSGRMIFAPMAVRMSRTFEWCYVRAVTLMRSRARRKKILQQDVVRAGEDMCLLQDTVHLLSRL